MIMGQTLDKKNVISKGLTLAFDTTLSQELSHSAPSGFFGRLKDLLFDHYKGVSDITQKEDFYVINETGFIDPFIKEKIMSIKMGTIEIGKYYQERNLLRIYFNPFSIRKILPFQENIPVALTDILKAIGDMGVKAINTDGLVKKLFISGFLKKGRERLKQTKESIKSRLTNINNNERDMRLHFETLAGLEDEKLFIEKNLEAGGKGMYEEIEKAKKLPFIDSISLGADSISMKFNPTTITIPNFKKGDVGKTFGKRTAYLGWIEFNISPSNIRVKGETQTGSGNGSGNPHPHSSGYSGDNGGSPCFGGGEGAQKIYSTLAANKFSDLANLLWIWIKTYRNKGAHIKIWDFYNDRLKQGYPMWDEKGTRVEINDKTRVKNGEQTTLSKASCYSANIKKFANMKKF